MKLLFPALLALMLNGSNPMFVGVDDQLLQTATITNKTLVAAVPETGLYRITGQIAVTRAATTSSSLTVTVTFTNSDQGGSRTITIGGFTSVGAVATTPTNSNTATGTMDFGKLVMASQGSAITYTATYASSGATTMQYALHIRCESL